MVTLINFSSQECEKTFHTNQVKFEEVQVHLNEVKQSKILTSPEFKEEFQDDCKDIAIDRAQILKQTKEHKNKYVLTAGRDVLAQGET